MQPSQVSQLFQSIRLSKPTQSALMLRVGQVISGKVVKFYPENRALIQIGQQQVIAQLDTNLEANQRYLLQVVEGEPAIKLKVVSNTPASLPAEQIERLLQAFGLKLSKNDQQLLQQLIERQVPLTRESLQQMFQLGKNDSQQMRAAILSEIAIRQLPITEEVYASLRHRMFEPVSFNQVVRNVQESLQNAPQSIRNFQLASQLQLFNTQRSSEQLLHTFMFQTLNEVGSGSRTTFDLFQIAGLIPRNMSFAEWTARWSSWATQSQATFQLTPDGLQASRLNTTQLPVSISFEQAGQNLSQLNQLQVSDPKQLETLVRLLQSVQQGEPINRMERQMLLNILQSPVGKQLQSQVSTQALQELTTRLSSQPNTIQAFMQSQQGQQLAQALETLLSNQVRGEEARALRFWLALLPQSNDVETFQHRFSGLTEMIARDSQGISRDYPSLPVLIQQINSGQPSSTLQSLQTILQAMNLSLEASRDWIQFSLQIPKEWFDLNEDMWMDFEGKKQSDGSIHPEHCRILFYLNLPALNEIVLDMQVINRAVDLTIYHAAPKQIHAIAKDQIEPLIEGLRANEYQFNGLHVKPLKKAESKVNQELYVPTQSYQGGIDFKI